MSAELVTLRETTLQDVAAHLRKLADAVERGEYGEVGCCAVAMLGNTLTVFAYGADGAGPSAACTLHAGFLQLQQAMLDHGK